MKKLATISDKGRKIPSSFLKKSTDEVKHKLMSLSKYDKDGNCTDLMVTNLNPALLRFKFSTHLLGK